LEVNIILLGLPSGALFGPTAISSVSLSFLPMSPSLDSIISKYMPCACLRGHRVVGRGCAAVLQGLVQGREDRP
jgi:hypothetical protein